MEKNGLLIFNGAQVGRNVKEKMIIYSRAGFGKTRLALSLTPRFGESLYYAADNGSEDLPSISEAKRSRIQILKPTGKDPILAFQQFAITDWRERFPKVGTIVVDTYTKVILDALQYSANTGAVTSEPHYRVGDPSNGGQIIPNRGDFRAIAHQSRGFLNNLFLHQAHYHIILVMHEDSKLLDGTNAVGGPAHAGWEMMEELPAMVGSVVRLVRETILVPGADVPEMRVVAVTDSEGKYSSKLRESDEENGNPMPRVVLDKNPVNFWKTFDKNFYKEN